MAALDDYLRSLPEGLRSFPGAQVKGNVLDEQLEWAAEVGAPLDPRVEPELKRLRPFGRTPEWVPEVVNNAVSLNARLGFDGDRAWLDALYDRQAELYRRPLYRALLMVLSPTLLLMAASDRWRAYRRGSDLVVDRWQRDGATRFTTGTLVHPPGLYSSLMLTGHARTLQAAIDAAGAEDSRVELEDEREPGRARYRLSYRG
ncbi:MAG TPA: hypothetical protein RMH99_12340 [Sandaracinaceae bacterium LLY-WYZ-13_1]|nr:hypothetical protein [Sandaracinaceae bacterium LLY-WYZ-13_1]